LILGYNSLIFVIILSIFNYMIHIIYIKIRFYTLRKTNLNYKEFLDFIADNKLSIQELQDALGYKEKSIINNWGKSKEVPEKALKVIKLYLELKQLREENHQLKKEMGTDQSANINLSDTALKIAKQKSGHYNISIEEYIASIIISNI